MDSELKERLMKFNFDIGKVGSVTVDMGKELVIDTSSPEAIANQLKDMSATVFYWGSIYEKAKVLESKIKRDFEYWYAQIHSVVKSQMVEKYGKTNTTESAIKYEIINSHTAEIREWEKKMAEAGYKKNMLRLAKDAFIEKDNDLVNLLAYYRRLAENGG